MWYIVLCDMVIRNIEMGINENESPDGDVRIDTELRMSVSDSILGFGGVRKSRTEYGHQQQAPNPAYSITNSINSFGLAHSSVSPMIAGWCYTTITLTLSSPNPNCVVVINH